MSWLLPAMSVRQEIHDFFPGAGQFLGNGPDIRGIQKVLTANPDPVPGLCRHEHPPCPGIIFSNSSKVYYSTYDAYEEESGNITEA